MRSPASRPRLQSCKSRTSTSLRTSIRSGLNCISLPGHRGILMAANVQGVEDIELVQKLHRQKLRGDIGGGCALTRNLNRDSSRHRGGKARISSGLKGSANGASRYVL